MSHLYCSNSGSSRPDHPPALSVRNRAPHLLAWQAAALKAEATEACRRLEAEKAALDTRVALLAPQFLGLEEGRSAVESIRREGNGGGLWPLLQQHRALSLSGTKKMHAL